MSDNKIIKLHKELNFCIQIKKLKDLDAIILQFPTINIRDCPISDKMFVYSLGLDYIELFSEEDDIHGIYIQCPPYTKLAILYCDIILKLLKNNLHTDLVYVYNDKKLIGGLKSLHKIIDFNSEDVDKAKKLLVLTIKTLFGESCINLATEQNISDGYLIILKIINNFGIYNKEQK